MFYIRIISFNGVLSSSSSLLFLLLSSITYSTLADNFSVALVVVGTISLEAGPSTTLPLTKVRFYSRIASLASSISLYLLVVDEDILIIYLFINLFN